MNDAIAKELSKDPDGLLTYEYIANNINNCAEDIDYLVDNMIAVDKSGQFVVSAARYLNAIDSEGFGAAIRRLVAAAIEKDRERRYLGDLLTSLYGADYNERAQQLSATDDNFRRIYKRLYPSGI
ncbi:MAG: hypothetical protein J6R27_01325 [Muribaculaceae bacterium]|nr:hypothetical protein [Muribaculaceae bacterium]